MDGLANKIKLDPKNNATILIAGGVMVLVGLIIFFANAFSPAPQTTVPTKEVVTKNEDKTYLKYIALKEEKTASSSPTLVPPTATPTPTKVPTPTKKSQTAESLTPSPTEIVLAVTSPTVSPTTASETTVEPTEVASLPTTGNIVGSVLVFVVSLSMIAFAFVL